MKLYLLKRRNDEVTWGEYAAKLIRASSPIKARQIANGLSGGEGKIWTDTDKVSCCVVNEVGPEGEIIADFMSD